MSPHPLATPRRRHERRWLGRQVVSALAYHKVAEIPPRATHRCNYVTPARFARQLQCLRLAGYRSISLADYVAHRQRGASLPARSVIITFDDGYRSNLEIALPILRYYGFTATIFVVAGLLGETNRWDAGEIQEPLLSADDVRAMHRLGIEFQSHTVTHPRLTQLSRDDAYRELHDSRALLEGVVDRPVTVIAYPWSEHDERVRHLAALAGYHAGVILRRRTNFDDTPLLQLRRIGINEDTSLARLGWDLARLRLRGA